MINLLHQSEKKKLKNEFRMRVAVAVAAALFVIELWSAAVFIPVYQIVYANTKRIAGALEQKRAHAPEVGEDLQRELAAITKDIKLLNGAGRTPGTLPSELLHALVGKKPAGVRFSSFAYGKQQDDLTLQVSGVADSRDDLIYFQRLLKEDERFKEVRYEQSFITKKTNIDFRLTITMKDAS